VLGLDRGDAAVEETLLVHGNSSFVCNPYTPL
jgi:hypothetical protein